MVLEVSITEAVDRYTILSIKAQKLLDLTKRIECSKVATNLYGSIMKTVQDYQKMALEQAVSEAIGGLLAINEVLWELEEKVRKDPKDLVSYNMITQLNDKRASIRKELAKQFGEWEEPKGHN